MIKEGTKGDKLKLLPKEVIVEAGFKYTAAVRSPGLGIVDVTICVV